MKVDDIYNTVLELFESVPFGNSDFQNRLVIVNKERTPARAYRHAALRIMNRLEALKEAHYNIRRRQIEIKLLERDLANEKDDLKKQLIEIEIEEKRSGERYTQKLVADAVQEIRSLWPVIQAIGKLPRQEFEDQEALHYREKHGEAVALEGDLYGAIQALGQNTPDLPDIPKLLTLLALDPDTK